MSKGGYVLKILVIFGTRPEAIKMAPVVLALKGEKALHVEVCVTGQHDEMIRPVLELFDIVPDYNLKVMRPNQTLNGLVSRVLRATSESWRCCSMQVLIWTFTMSTGATLSRTLPKGVMSLL